MEGERVFLSPILRPVERAVYRVAGVDETTEQGWNGYAVAVLVMAARRHRRRLRRAPPAGRPAAQPGRDPGHVTRARVQHVGQLRDQHQLAELLGRDRGDLPHAGGRPRGPQLHLRRDRPGHRDRAVPRADPPQREDHRQLLGRPDPRRPVPAAADLDRRRARARVAGRPPDLGSRPRPSRRSRARSRTSRSAPSPPRSGSRSWATTAAGSSTRTRPTRSRTPRRSPTGSRCSRSCCSRSR